MKKSPSLRHRGAALIVVLSIIVLVSGLVVGLAMAMRMERSASFYHLERLRADLLARQGVDYGEALLKSATTNNRFWVSAPGRIYASDTNSFGAPTNYIDLSSGVTLVTNAAISADLNRHGWSGGDRLLDRNGTNFNVKWIYVKKTGGYDTNSPTVDTNVVGRFAFWVDDESSRVNLSTANQRTTNSSDWSNPQEIDIAALPGMSDFVTDASIQARLLKGAFNTPYEVFGYTNTLPGAALSTNRFFITHYNQDPDVDPWGRARIVLTAARAVPVWNVTNYIKILKDSPSGPPNVGELDDLDEMYVGNTMTNIMSRLTQTNWPYVGDSSASWSKKYGTNGAAQLALDIIEYVRSAESTNIFIEPLTATVGTTNVTYEPNLRYGTFAVDSLIGTTRRPLISELAVFIEKDTNATGKFPGKLAVEVYLPPGYGVAATNFAAAYNYHLLSSFATTPTQVTAVTNSTQFVQFTQDIEVPPMNVSDRPTNVNLRVALLKANDPTGLAKNILDIAPLAANDFINYAVDDTNIIAINGVHSYEVRDPRVNKRSLNWERMPTNAPTSTNTLGAINSRWRTLMEVPTGMPRPDTDVGGNVTEVSLQMARTGIVGSVGELGYIQTGVISNAPWRSVRLQPVSDASTNALPDWALLDLFSAPVVNTNYLPSTNAVAGRINLNTLVMNTSSTNMTRTNVLNTLFTNTAVTNMSGASSFPTIISNVVMATNLAVNGLNYGNATNGRIFESVGQIAEIKGIADGGEASEQAIRQIASLATVRGNVFSIYSVGQAIQVTKSGKVNVNGEKMVRAIVERTLSASGEPQYKVIYWSEIYP